LISDDVSDWPLPNKILRCATANVVLSFRKYVAPAGFVQSSATYLIAGAPILHRAELLFPKL